MTSYRLIAATVLAICIGAPPASARQQAAVQVPIAVLDRYVGEYDQNGSTVRITRSGSTLFREASGQRVPLVPISASLFSIGPVFTAEFVSTPAGDVTMIVASGAVEYRLPRKGSRVGPVQAPPVAEVRVPRAVLARYAGTYEYIPGQMDRTDLSFTVLLKGDTLIRIMAGARVVLTPVSETVFRVRGTSLHTEFVIDDAGVTQILGSGQQQVLARLTRPAVAPADLPAATSPADEALSDWLAAFNSADSTQLRAYFDRYRLTRSMTAQLSHRRLTGGYSLVSIEKSTPRYLEFVVRARATGASAVGVIELNPEGTPGLKNLMVQEIGPGRTAGDFTVDGTRRASVIERVVDALRNGYLSTEGEDRMIADLLSRFRRGEYDGITNGLTFAARLTEHLQASSRDRHMRVFFSAGGAPAPQTSPQASGASSCGFTVAIEPDKSVAMIKFNEFPSVNVCAREATRALDQVADADALIFDLRENIGGQGLMAAHIASYLLDGRTHFNTVMSRRRDPVTKRFAVPEQFFAYPEWTTEVRGPKYGGTKPVYVLTSRLTFSAAEAFAYNLQALKRATIIGEQTAGGAHLFNGRRELDDQFSIAVPHMRPVNPVTGANWEGTGISPDVRVPGAHALQTAIDLIEQTRKRRPPRVLTSSSGSR